MSCAFPPEVDRSDLLAYLDGEADEEVVWHLKRCAHCRQRAQALARLQRRLTDALYRVTCPEPQELGEFHLGRLSVPRRAEIRRHLGECPHCTREVAQLGGYLEELRGELGPGPLERLRILVAELISGPGLSPLGQPALAGVRGGALGPRIYRAEEVQVALVAEEDDEHPGSRILAGLVTGIQAQGFEARMLREGRAVARVEVDDLGNFGIGDLPAGTYELLLAGPQIEIHVPTLEI